MPRLLLSQAPSAKTPKIMQFGAMGDLVQRYGGQKRGSRRGRLGISPLSEELWMPCKQGYIWTLSLKLVRWGAHDRGACQNHTHSKPQITPLGKCSRLGRAKPKSKIISPTQEWSETK